MRKILPVALFLTVGCASAMQATGLSPAAKHESAPISVTPDLTYAKAFPEASGAYKTALEAWNKENGYETVRTYTTASQWTMERHPQTGVLTGRSVAGNNIVRGKDGNCYMFSQCWLNEAEQGNGKFGSPSGGCNPRDGFHPRVTCESVNQLPPSN